MTDHAGDRLLLIDFLNLAFRAFSVSNTPAKPGQEERLKLTGPDGTDVGGLQLFLSMTYSLIAEARATHVAFVFDSVGPTFRRALIEDFNAARAEADRIPEYKAGRAEIDEPKEAACQLMNRATGALGFARYRAEGFEADDALLALASQAEAVGFGEVFIATGDRDLFGAVTDTTTMLWTSMGMPKIKENTFGPAQVEAKYGVPVALFADLKALVGDPGDRIPGCPRIGKATAPGLLATFGSFEGLYAALDAHVAGTATAEQAALIATVRPAVVKTLLAGEATARLSLVLATLRRDAPVTLDPAIGLVGHDERARSLAFLRRYGLASIERRLPSPV